MCQAVHPLKPQMPQTTSWNDPGVPKRRTLAAMLKPQTISANSITADMPISSARLVMWRIRSKNRQLVFKDRGSVATATA